MTPQEKAEKLLDNFIWCATTPEQTAPLAKEVAKQCAIICVEEILDNGGDDRLYLGSNDREYWNEVLTEIEKI